MSWASETGTIPVRLTSPVVGLMPAIPHALDGQTIDPSVTFLYTQGSPMTLKITDDEIISDASSHTARRYQDGAWQVTWLPGRKLDRNLAITAMTLADIAACGVEPEDERWPLIGSLAAELGYPGPAAIVRASSLAFGLLR